MNDSNQYTEFVTGLSGQKIAVGSKGKPVAPKHETFAEKGVVNSPDKSPFALGGVSKSPVDIWV